MTLLTSIIGITGAIIVILNNISSIKKGIKETGIIIFVYNIFIVLKSKIKGLFLKYIVFLFIITIFGSFFYIYVSMNNELKPRKKDDVNRQYYEVRQKALFYSQVSSLFEKNKKKIHSIISFWFEKMQDDTFGVTLAHNGTMFNPDKGDIKNFMPLATTLYKIGKDSNECERLKEYFYNPDAKESYKGHCFSIQTDDQYECEIIKKLIINTNPQFLDSNPKTLFFCGYPDSVEASFCWIMIQENNQSTYLPNTTLEYYSKYHNNRPFIRL